MRHEDIANGGEIVCEMSAKVEDWGNGLLVSLLYYSSVFLHLVCSNDVPSKRADNRNTDDELQMNEEEERLKYPMHDT